MRSSKNAFIMQSKSTFLEFLRCIHRYKFGPPNNFSGAKLFMANDVVSIEHVLCSQQESSFTFCLASWCASLSSLTFSSRLVCFLVEFWTVLPCLYIIYVHEHDRLCFPMVTVETPVFDCICWLSSSRDRKGQSYPVQYCLESVEEYSECTIHKGEPEPRKGNVNTVYFLNQARANTRISRTEFIYDEGMRLQMVTHIWASYLE